MKLQYFIIGIMVVAAFVAGTTGFIADMQASTGVTVDASYNETYDKIDDMLNLTSDATSTLQGADVEVTAFEALQLANFPIIKMVVNAFGVISSLINDISLDLGLASWIAPVILGIISVLLLFAAIAAIFGRKT